jgi:hypothetical protein
MSVQGFKVSDETRYRQRRLVIVMMLFGYIVVGAGLLIGDVKEIPINTTNTTNAGAGALAPPMFL